ncbi:MAG: hypothetical protein B1H08_02955, partial [Candidatus Omnitrophica bacterium 4484_171]
MDTEIIKKITFLGVIVILGSLFYYQIIRGDYYLERSKANYIRVIPEDAVRGSIMDTNKRIIACDVPAFGIAVVPYQMRKDRRAVFSRVSVLLNIPEEKIEDNYKKNIKSPFSPVEIATHINKSAALHIKDELGDKIIIKSIPYR